MLKILLSKFSWLVFCLIVSMTSAIAATDVTIASYSAYIDSRGPSAAVQSGGSYYLEVEAGGTPIHVSITLQRPSDSHYQAGVFLRIADSKGVPIGYDVGNLDGANTTANRDKFTISSSGTANNTNWEIDNTQTSRQILDISNNAKLGFSLGTSNPNAESALAPGYYGGRYLYACVFDFSTYKVTAVSKGIPLNFLPNSPLPRPSLTSLAPVSGTTGTVIKLTGINLKNVTRVYIPTKRPHAVKFSVISDTEISVTIPPSSVSGLISVGNDSYDSNSINFTVLPPTNAPVLLTFRNDLDQSGGGLIDHPLVNVILPGNGIRLYLPPGGPSFDDYGVVAVDFNGVRVSGTSLIYYSDYVLRVLAPAGITPGKVSVITTNLGSSNGLTYRFPTPQPVSGAEISGTQYITMGSIPAPIVGRIVANGSTGDYAATQINIGALRWSS